MSTHSIRRKFSIAQDTPGVPPPNIQVFESIPHLTISCRTYLGFQDEIRDNIIGNNWNKQKLQILFDADIVDQICGIPIPDTPQNDSFVWVPSTNRSFTIKSATWMQNAKAQPHEQSPLIKKLWKLNVPPKVKIFGWLVLRGKLKTRDRLHRFEFLNHNICPLCNIEEETMDHLFYNCPSSLAIWNLAHSSSSPAVSVSLNCSALKERPERAMSDTLEPLNPNLEEEQWEKMKMGALQWEPKRLLPERESSSPEKKSSSRVPKRVRWRKGQWQWRRRRVRGEGEESVGVGEDQEAARSRRERRDLREGSRSTKAVRRWAPFSTTVQKEKMRKERKRKRKMRRLEVKEEEACRRSCNVDLRSWRHRNEIFSPHVVVAGAAAFTRRLNSQTNTSFCVATHSNNIKWSLPPSGYVKLNFDGSVLQHNSNVASGFVLRNDSGCPLVASTKMIGKANVPIAEVVSLRDGLLST
ncbi:hypothetical protein ACLB2K_047338 [Fragaria x ananassa]